MLRFKMLRDDLESIREDLSRPHAFAGERVGFIACRFAPLQRGKYLALATGYQAVRDEDYLDDDRYGALISSDAFRRAMQFALTENVGLFHTHMHDHKGSPKPSAIDIRETAQFIPDFFHVRPKLPHGAIILSRDRLSGRVWNPRSRQPQSIAEFTVVGSPLISVLQNE